MTEILIIKHGALGDIILATGPFATIRAAHPEANITLLTAKPYDMLLKDAPYFDDIWLDEKPKIWQLGKTCSLRKLLRSKQFDYVYDLQTSERSTRYFRSLAHPALHYSGLAKGGSHPHNTAERTSLHTIDRQRQQLEIAGLSEVQAPNIDWLEENISSLKPTSSYALLVPGGSAHRPEKRWPAEQFTVLANTLSAQNITPVWIGAGAEESLLQQLAEATPGSVNLCNQTSFAQLATLARHAEFAVGNDTGPIHIIAATGCATRVLFSHASNPDLCAPRGENVRLFRTPNLAQLSPEEVLTSLPLEAANKKA